ncbi:sensor histidine kinase [Spirosoma gilvum]
MERLNDKWIRWVAIPISILLANLVYLKEYNYDPVVYLSWAIFGMVYVAIVWEIQVRWLLLVRKRYEAIEQTRRRVLFTLVGLGAITTVSQLGFVYLTDATHLALVQITGQVYLIYLAIGFASILMVGGFYEVTYYLQRYRQAVEEAEAVKKAGLQSQYDSLKNQVNPHFLFNALNSLSALIADDKKQAGLFIDELASVYRYILQAGQRPLVTLSDELDFLTAYRYLLDTRFSRSDGPSTLCWEIDIHEQYQDCLLPSLTLQTLVENALRHNSLLVEQPLRICMYTTDDGMLIVRNTILRKKMAVNVQQQGGGLATLAIRFESFGLARPVIDDDGHFFTVRLAIAPKEQVDVYSLIAKPVVS